MKLTVAVPSYNKEKYIERCLASIVREKESIDTILLVDNNSSDKTFELAKTFEPDVTCVKNETNLGMSGNWNRCIDLCETEWLMIVHADDEILPGAIEHYKRMIEKYPTAGIIYANAYAITEEDESTITISKFDQKEFHKAGLEAMKCKTSVCSAVMVKKEAYDRLGYFIEKSISSDIEMWHRISSKYDTVFLNLPTVMYRITASSTGFNSLISRDLEEIKEDWDTLNTQMASHYPTKESRDLFLKECFTLSPGGYFAITKANLRAGNYYKALRPIIIIIFTYRAFFPLLSMILAIIRKRILLLFTKQ